MNRAESGSVPRRLQAGQYSRRFRACYRGSFRGMPFPFRTDRLKPAPPSCRFRRLPRQSVATLSAIAHDAIRRSRDAAERRTLCHSSTASPA